jgi:hypothetical protein
MKTTTFNLTASGQVAGPFEVEEYAMGILIVTSDMTLQISRSLDGTNWVALESYTASTSKNLEGPGFYKIEATTAGTALVQVRRL